MRHPEQDSGERDSGATSALASFAANLVPGDLPDSVLQILLGCTLDFIGITAFAARFGDSSPAIRAGVQRLDPVAGPATVVGEPRGYAPPYAALLNGAFAHTLDFDDTNAFQYGHPGAPVLAACLVEAERLGASGAAFLTAAAAGYEVAVRVGAALNQGGYERGFHITSISGIFGAVAAVANLNRLPAGIVGQAFGLALSKAAGSMQYLENGAWNKRLHPGFAAHDALVCVAMAEAGVVGADAALEGRYGVLACYSTSPEPTILTDGLGTRWTLLETAIKPYPSCRLTHGAIDAALELRKSFTPVERRAAQLTLRISATAWTITGMPTAGKLTPRNNVDAQFSIYYQTAVAWLHGFPTWQDYERLNAPDVLDMIGSISVEKVAGFVKAEATLMATVNDRQLDATVLTPLGEPETPFGWDGIMRKFRSMAEPVYGAGVSSQIAGKVAGLPQLNEILELTALLKFKMPASP